MKTKRFSRWWQFSQVQAAEVIDGMEVRHPRYIMIPKVGMALHGWFMFLSLLPIMRKIEREAGFDLIDAHYVFPDGFAAVLLGRALHKPVVVSARGSDINLFKDISLIRKMLQYTLRTADKAIAVSQALREAILGLGIAPEKVALIPNGVDTKKFYIRSKTEARAKLNLPTGKILLSVGNLTANKGFDLLVSAVRTLRNDFQETTLTLIIIGEGEFRSAIERRIAALGMERCVKLMGAVPHQHLGLWYSAADLFCLASAREGWPNVLLESLACGTPVVATAVGGIPEIIRSTEVGILTQRNDREIAQTIALALKKSWQVERIAQYAQGYTWNRVALDVLDVFSAVLDGRPERSVSLLSN
jgi:glycosyltransferase involved in cell wall biosynthesis